MGFKIDHKEAFAGGILPPGEYEAVILAAHEDITKNGKLFLNVPMVVRNDVEQGYKNARIWHKLWKRKEPTAQDRQCNDYSWAQINSLSKAIGLPDGKNYKDLDEWMGDLRHRPLRVKIKHGKWNDEPQAEVDALSVAKFPKCNHTFKQEDTKGKSNDAPIGFSVEVSEDELPF